MREISEYWLIAPEQSVVMVLALTEDGSYQEAIFSGSDRIVSSTFSNFALTAEQVLNPPE